MTESTWNPAKLKAQASVSKALIRSIEQTVRTKSQIFDPSNRSLAFGAPSITSRHPFSSASSSFPLSPFSFLSRSFLEEFSPHSNALKVAGEPLPPLPSVLLDKNQRRGQGLATMAGCEALKRANNGANFAPSSPKR